MLIHNLCFTFTRTCYVILESLPLMEEDTMYYRYISCSLPGLATRKKDWIIHMEGADVSSSLFNLIFNYIIILSTQHGRWPNRHIFSTHWNGHVLFYIDTCLLFGVRSNFKLLYHLGRLYFLGP